MIYIMFVAQKSEKYISKLTNGPSSLRYKMMSFNWLKWQSQKHFVNRDLQKESWQ